MSHVADIADVGIVGGGPVGLATAIACRAHGLTAVVVERAPHLPIDKACGEGMMPGAVAALAELGVELPREAGRPFRGIRYLDGGLVVEAPFPDGRRGLGLRRPKLHDALLARALAVGVEVRAGWRAVGLAPSGIETARGPIAARFVVGADGLGSKVREWAGLAGRPAARRRFGVRRHYRVAPWTDLVEAHWAAGCEAYVTPVGPEEVCVVLLWSGIASGFDALLSRVPGLAQRLAAAPIVTADRGAGPLEQRVRARRAGTRVALVGDAAGYLDPLTGEGLALGLRQALDLAACLAAGKLERYPALCRRSERLPLALTRLALAAETHPRLRRRAFAALARDPELFSRVLGLLVGATPLSRLGWGRALRFVGRLAHAA